MKKLLAKLNINSKNHSQEKSALHHPVPKTHGKNNSLTSTILILVLAPIVAILLTTFVFQSYQVDGASMETTLQNNNRLIINKLPRTWAKISGNQYVPNRGEVIIFTKHNLDQYDQSNGDKQLIKRVVGLPGERVVVKDGKLIVYSKNYPKGYEPDKSGEYEAKIGSTPGNIDLTIPEGEIFVSGDNRANSLDSRTFGSVPVKDIVGRLSFRLFPLSDAKKF